MPSDPNSPFAQVWCARDRLLAMESLEPITDLVVNTDPEVDRSIAEQIRGKVPASNRRQLLGDLLVAEGVITSSQLMEALHRQKPGGRRL